MNPRQRWDHHPNTNGSTANCSLSRCRSASRTRDESSTQQEKPKGTQRTQPCPLDRSHRLANVFLTRGQTTQLPYSPTRRQTRRITRSTLESQGGLANPTSALEHQDVATTVCHCRSRQSRHSDCTPIAFSQMLSGECAHCSGMRGKDRPEGLWTSLCKFAMQQSLR